MNRRSITVSVETDDPDTLSRAVETLARAMTGLALEGIPAFLTIDDPEPEETT